MLPFFPLANGLLTGKVRRDTGAPERSRLAGRDSYLTDDKFDRVEALEKWGAEHGRTLLEIAIAGLGAQPTVGSVIAGATKPEQVRANAAAGEWVPTADELAEINRAGALADELLARRDESRSNAAAARSVNASDHRGPMTDSPTGSPSASPAGTDVAGSPARLAGRQLVHQSSKNGSTGFPSISAGSASRRRGTRSAASSGSAAGRTTVKNSPHNRVYAAPSVHRGDVLGGSGVPPGLDQLRAVPGDICDAPLLEQRGLRTRSPRRTRSCSTASVGYGTFG